VRGIHAPIAQSNDEKLLLADAILGFRNVPACTFQGRFLSFHTTPPAKYARRNVRISCRRRQAVSFDLARERVSLAPAPRGSPECNHYTVMVSFRHWLRGSAFRPTLPKYWSSACPRCQASAEPVRELGNTGREIGPLPCRMDCRNPRFSQSGSAAGRQPTRETSLFLHESQHRRRRSRTTGRLLEAQCATTAGRLRSQNPSIRTRTAPVIRAPDARTHALG